MKLLRKISVEIQYFEKVYVAMLLLNHYRRRKKKNF